MLNEEALSRNPQGPHTSNGIGEGEIQISKIHELIEYDPGLNINDLLIWSFCVVMKLALLSNKNSKKMRLF